MKRAARAPLACTWHWGWACALLLLACSKVNDQSPLAPSEATTPKTDPRALTSASNVSPDGAPDAIGAPATEPGVLPPLTPGGERVVKGRLGMVSTVESHATQVGVQILRAGGNAVDAAVAIGYALAVTHPSAGNIGGGGFMLIKRAGKPAQSLDFRETAPAALTQKGFDRMIDDGGSGARSSGVPGSVAGLNFALEHYGTLTRSQVLAPAIALAQDGHTLGERQALVLGWVWGGLKRDPAAQRIFGAAGKPLQQGALLKQPELAALLQRIATEGNAGFYAGASAQAIVQSVHNGGGWISAQDLLDYRPVERAVLTTRYHGFELEVMPPPSAGGVAIVQMLGMLEQLGAARNDAAQGDGAAADFEPGSAANLHLFIEVAKRAHAERRFHVGDPDTLPGYDDAARRQRWANARLWLDPFPIDPHKPTPAANLHPLYSAASRELDHTTHFSVVDKDGMAVSCTMTLSAGFGARYVVPELGLVMNNSVAAFGTVGDNVPLPRRRTTSSMSPLIVSHEGQLALVLGTPGGDTIPSTLVLVLQRLLDAKQPLDLAVDAPRLHHGFVPDELRTETSRPLPKATRDALRAMGHTFGKPNTTIGDVNLVLAYGQDLYGYADPREGGVAAAADP